MAKWIDKLAARWSVSPGKVFIILLTFACTGFTIMFLKYPILDIIVGEKEKMLWHSVLYYLMILPLYNLVLLFYGFIFGQFSFFWAFEKRFFKRLFGRK